MSIVANSYRYFFLAQLIYRFLPWVMFLATGTYFTGPWPVKTPDQTPGLGLTSSVVPLNRTCVPGNQSQGHEWFAYDTCPPGGLCDMADDMAKMMTLDQVDLLGTMIVIPLLLSNDDIIKIVPWATLAVFAQILSYIWVASEGNMSSESMAVNFPGYFLLLIWGVAISYTNGKAKTSFPPTLAQLKPNTLCKKYLLAEGGLLAFFAFCFAIPPLASGILGGLAENDQAPCFRINACPNIDRLCEHARSISKIYTGSCLHWSLYYPGVMQISHDGIMKMTFWISFLWMLDVYPGWAIGYTKRIHGPNLTGILICFFLWGFVAPAYPWYSVWKENNRSAIPRPLSFLWSRPQKDEKSNYLKGADGGSDYNAVINRSNDGNDDGADDQLLE